MRRCNGLTVTTSPRPRAHRDAEPIMDNKLTTDACERPQCGCLRTVRLAPRHVVVGQSPGR